MDVKPRHAHILESYNFNLYGNMPNEKLVGEKFYFPLLFLSFWKESFKKILTGPIF